MASLCMEGRYGIVRKISLGRFDKDRFEKLYQAAEHTLGATEGKASLLLEFMHLVSNSESGLIFARSVAEPSG